jgi:hypothetical protein
MRTFRYPSLAVPSTGSAPRRSRRRTRSAAPRCSTGEPTNVRRAERPYLSLCSNRAATWINLLKCWEKCQSRNSAICGSFASSRDLQQTIVLLSHGRGRWFETSIAHFRNYLQNAVFSYLLFHGGTGGQGCHPTTGRAGTPRTPGRYADPGVGSELDRSVPVLFSSSGRWCSPGAVLTSLWPAVAPTAVPVGVPLPQVCPRWPAGLPASDVW